MGIVNNALSGASGQSSGYNLTNSLRFRSSASANLSRTFSTPTDNKKWTWSGWVKRGELGTSQTILGGYSSGTGQFPLYFTSSNTLAFYDSDGVSTYYQIGTSAVFRDPSAWYHIVFVFDSANATQANRIIIYVNGVSQTLSSIGGSPGGLLPLNRPSYWNASSAANNIGCYTAPPPTAYNFLDGYLTEVNFVDGQALTPSSFGETSSTTGVWIPKKYTGTYGANGFYLPFTNTASTSTLGNDFSGNSNTWTVNNISLTAGSTYDSMTDVPTLTSATTANYCVMNPLRIQNVNIGAGTISDGNLKITTSASDNAYSNHYGTMAFPTTGKWYFEAVFAGAFGNDAGNYAGITGVSNGNAACTIVVTSTTAIQKNFSNVQTGLSFAAGDILGVAFDATNLTVDFYKNGSAFGSQVTGLDSVEYTPFILAANPANTQSSWTSNFGQRPFAYTPPTGFNRLNTFNLPTPTIGASASTQANDYFDVSLYTGNSGTQSITNSGSMQPDFVWLKSRSNALDHGLFDSVRGVQNVLASNGTGAANYGGTGELTAFNSNGFTLVNSGSYQTNQSGYTYVAWQWRASNAAGVTNTAGSITSTVSANTTAGFSVVTYTGVGGSGTTTVGHGLGVSPSMVIIKRRNSTADWATYHTGLTSTSYYLFLNSTAGQANYGSTFISPSSSTLTIDAGSSLLNTSTGTYVAYCFAPVAGYSAFGSYTGNGSSDGPFIFTGFRPRFLMIKRTDTTNNWVIQDTSRDTYNVSEKDLYADTSGAEATYAAEKTDILSNGFKQRQTGASMNASGGTYIYMAFAENPFKYSLAR
jgi:hypothetical protein